MTLKEEIMALPAALLTSQEHGEIAARLSLGRTKTVVVPIADIQAYLQTNGLWTSIKETANSASHPAKNAASALLDVATSRYANINMMLPIVGQLLGGLVATGVITQAQKDELAAMSVMPDVVTNQEVIDIMRAM